MKKNRQGKIIEIIQKYDVETQEELAGLLQQEGFHATQATVSRDIRELKLFKAPGANGGQKYVILGQGEEVPGNRYGRVLQEAFKSVQAAQNILVIKTVPGMAMAAAAALDAMELPEVVGCIAGDDTIFAAVRSAEEAERLAVKIQKTVN
jgi:transcriptional regulator of arginine metabolism